jgi:hypothetical protein
MTFSNARQVAALTLAWAVSLFAVDYVKNPHLWQRRPAAVAGAGPRVSLWVEHLCCTGCLGDLREALAPLPWVRQAVAVRGGGVVDQQTADAQARALPDYGQWVDLDVPDLGLLDFVALDRAVREKGLVPGRMELSGVEHFRLKAEVPHLCCGMCQRSVEDGIAFVKARGVASQLRWLDSITADKTKRLIVAHARFLERGKTVDVAELLAGLNEVGLSPRSLRVEVEESRPLRVASHSLFVDDGRR